MKRSKDHLEKLQRRLEEQTAQLAELTLNLNKVFEVARSALAEAAPQAAARLEYLQLQGEIRQMVAELVPEGSTVLVVSKGDEALLELGTCAGRHFPQDREGRYPGFTPADSGSAIVQLEAQRAKGAEYLLIPRTSSWWLDHYTGLRRHLQTYYRLLTPPAAPCVVYSLVAAPLQEDLNSVAGLGAVLAEFERRFEHAPTVLDWNSGLDLAGQLPGHSVFSPPDPDDNKLPYLSETVDLVVVPSSEPSRMVEARRAATSAVVAIRPAGKSAKSSALRVEWLRESEAEPLPTTSVVIPSYNGIALTEDCLKALQETLPADFRGEIIVVDDCSTDDTPKRLAAWQKKEPRLKVLRNPKNSGFVVTCNNGASAATGEIVILLNNDTLPQRGWLEPLLRVFRQRPDAGAVGGKLVYPDGRLQDAGGIVFSDASAANFGKWEYALDDPLFNYIREVDYVTGALIATRRDLFNELGQLDTRYQPIYYEETDYCFRVRQHGYKVYYQPESVVIHLEGVTCGTDLQTGPKRYQLVNQAKFYDRWRKVLKRQPRRPARYDLATWHELASPLATEGTGRT